MMKLGASVLIALVLSATACSSSSSATTTTSASAGAMSAADYAAGVCSAMSTFESDVQQAQSSFNPNTTDLATLKQSWLSLLDGMIQATQNLVSSIQALGVPDTSDGQQAADALKTDFTKLQQDLQSLRDHSDALSPTNPGDFMTTFEPLVQQFQTDMQGFGQDLAQLNGGELETAFSQAPECAAITSGSASPSASPSA